MRYKNIAVQQTLERPLYQVMTRRVGSYHMDIVSSNLPLFNGDESPKRPYGVRYTVDKPCTRCHQVKSVSEFSIKQRNYRGLPTYTSWCKSCLAENKRNRYSLAYAQTDYRKRIYGIDDNIYQAMFFRQGGVCAVCGQPQNAKYTKELCIDHNHETGQVRELLCHTCNILLGYVEKDRSRVKRLIKYLKKHDT